MEEEKRTEAIMIRFTKSELEEIDRERKKMGMNRTEYVRFRIYFDRYKEAVNGLSELSTRHKL